MRGSYGFLQVALTSISRSDNDHAANASGDPGPELGQGTGPRLQIAHADECALTDCVFEVNQTMLAATDAGTGNRGRLGDKVAVSRAELAGLGSDVGDRLAIYDQFQTDMSPGGYWLHTSVDLATTPLLLKKIFM